MTLNRINVQEIKQFTDNQARLMANTIYHNFAYLADRPSAQHHLPEIIRLVTSEQLFGYLLHNQKGDLIGYLIGEFKNLLDGRRVFYLSYIYISKQYRKRKLGSRLIEMLKNRIKYIDGLGFIVLTCNRHYQPIQEYYFKHGFVNDPIIAPTQDTLVLTCYL